MRGWDGEGNDPHRDRRKHILGAGVNKLVMRLALLVLPLLLLLGGVSSAQTPSSAAMASPVAGPSEATITQPPMGWPQRPPWCGSHPQPPRFVRIVFFALRALLMLSAIFALTALGIFLIRRSRPRPG
jgi:hypothetical protein